MLLIRWSNDQSFFFPTYLHCWISLVFLCLRAVISLEYGNIKWTERTTTSLHRWATDMSVIDSWHLVNPSFRDNSFYSAHHKSILRIDDIFISKDLGGRVHNALHIPKTFSDHNAVLSQINISLGIPRAARWYFNTFTKWTIYHPYEYRIVGIHWF